MASATVESYVKAVYRLSRMQGNQAVTTGQLAEAMGVSPGTVTSMLKTLHESELAYYAPYEGVRLTPLGERLALRIYRRHRLLESFLCRSLELPWDMVHEDAERMEHHISDFLIERIDDYLGHPTHDPHGDPIPAADGTVASVNSRPLVDCPVGARFRLVRVTDQSPEFLRYLTQSGLSLETIGLVTANRVEAGIVVVEVGGREVNLSRVVAGNLLVTPVDSTPAPGVQDYSASEPFLNDATLRDAPRTTR